MQSKVITTHGKPQDKDAQKTARLMLGMKMKREKVPFWGQTGKTFICTLPVSRTWEQGEAQVRKSFIQVPERRNRVSKRFHNERKSFTTFVLECADDTISTRTPLIQDRSYSFI